MSGRNLRVFEHFEACPAPCGGGTVTRSMRRVANATLLRFDRYDELPVRLAPRETPDPITDIRARTRVSGRNLPVFEHFEACPAPCGGGTVTRSMRRVANATLLRFDRYDEPRTRALFERCEA